jgi:hypothetical protein
VTHDEMLQAMFVLRWWQMGLTLVTVFLVIVLIVSKWLQYYWQGLETTEYMTELRALLTAARVAAESARSNQVDATSARADVTEKMDTNVARLERTIPEATAAKVEERLHGNADGMHT